MSGHQRRAELAVVMWLRRFEFGRNPLLLGSPGTAPLLVRVPPLLC